eukprot:g15404.t1
MVAAKDAGKSGKAEQWAAHRVGAGRESGSATQGGNKKSPRTLRRGGPWAACTARANEGNDQGKDRGTA